MPSPLVAHYTVGILATIGDVATLADPQFTPWRAVGRLHPFFTHFPIALVFAAAAVEGARWVRRLCGIHVATVWFLCAAAATGWLATGTGWLFAAWEAANDDRWQLDAHRWWGTGGTVLLTIVALLAWRTGRDRTALASGGRFDTTGVAGRGSLPLAVRSGTLASLVVIGLVGHLGGDLVHGQGHILKGLFSRVPDRRARSAVEPVRPTSWPAPSASAAPDDAGASRRAFYVGTIEPLLAARCVECHGDDRQKGGLRLSPIAAAFEGDPQRWSIRPGDAAGSELLARVLLPRDDPDAMPPEGEGLTEAEIEALRAWIDDGAAGWDRDRP